MRHHRLRAPDRVSREPGTTPVDVLLVLAVDVSESVSQHRSRLQRDGYRAALRHELILLAIRSGPHGAIGLAYVHWAGIEYQRLLVPWTRVADRADAEAWADRMEAAASAASGEPAAAAFPNAPATSISGGIRFAAALFEDAPWEAERRVVDVSGDGPNNDGPPLAGARDAALAQGLTINGLAIEGGPDVERELGPGARLEAYYRAFVIGGPAAFVVPVEHPGAFRDAVHRKLMLEIAGRGDLMVDRA